MTRRRRRYRFTYSQNNLGSVSPAAAPTAGQGQQYALQYAQLKKEMLGRTQRFGGLLGAYIFLTISGEVGQHLHQQFFSVVTWSIYRTVAILHMLPLMQAAFCSLLGSAASYAYLLLIQQQVDSVSPTDEVPIWEAEDNVEGLARPFAIGLAGYR